jgi:hypothetical protein
VDEVRHDVCEAVSIQPGLVDWHEFARLLEEFVLEAQCRCPDAMKVRGQSDDCTRASSPLLPFD